MSEQKYLELYAVLAAYHNFDATCAMDSQKWQIWQAELKQDLQYLDGVIQTIRNGALVELMGRRSIPNLGDIKALVKQVRKNAEPKFSHRIEDNQPNLSPSQAQKRLDKIRQKARKPAFDLNKPFNRADWDAYLNRVSKCAKS